MAHYSAAFAHIGRAKAQQYRERVRSHQKEEGERPAQTLPLHESRQVITPQEVSYGTQLQFQW